MSNIPREKSFWSMIIDSNCKQTFTVERSFHISKAVIDWTNLYHQTRPSLIARLMVDCENKIGIILCELMKKDPCNSLKPEADLDVHFRVGQKKHFIPKFLGMEPMKDQKSIFQDMNL